VRSLFYLFVNLALRALETFYLLSNWENKNYNHHHQPINVPIAGAQAFHMDYPQGERAITTQAQCGLDWWVLTTANAAGTNGLMCLPKHGRAQILGHPSDDRPMLLSFRDRTRSHGAPKNYNKILKWTMKQRSYKITETWEFKLFFLNTLKELFS
jgi:hypothetical protein